MWADLLFLYFAFLAYLLMFVLGCLAVAWLGSIRVTKVSIGNGPALIKRGRVIIRPLPLSGFVRYFDNRDPENEGSDENAFDRKPLLVRVLAHLAGPASALLGALILRGTATFSSLSHGFDQIIAGALSPQVTGVALVNRMLDLPVQAGYAAALGALLAKIAAFNLLPLPILAGGAAILELLLPNQNWPTVQRVREILQQVGLCILVPLWLSWLFAVSLALYGRMSGG